MAERDYDVVIYGASGFTGRQAVEWFARQVGAGRLRWAIAGRNRARLEAVHARLGELAPRVGVIVADAGDQPALELLASRTRVVLSTAGPYALYGSGLVAACVHQRTHYVDITGETVWVRELIDRHQVAAAASGTRIIPFCGFDSVPSDLGALLLVRYLARHFGITGPRVAACHRMKGGLNGGTMATVFNLYESGQANRAADPFLLNPDRPAQAPTPRPPAGSLVGQPAGLDEIQDPRGPRYDNRFGIWTAPFVMGPINTRVVRRSAALFAAYGEGYGDEFSYQEYAGLSGAGGAIAATILSLGSAVFGGLMQSPVRRLLRPLFPAPGQGPSTKIMDEGWFRCDLVATDPDGRCYRALIAGQGDPGNRATINFLGEAALTLALETERLPGGPARGGVLTPATGLGEPLAERLRRGGMTIEVGDLPESPGTTSL